MTRDERSHPSHGGAILRTGLRWRRWVPSPGSGSRVFLVAILGGVALAGVRGLAAWRASCARSSGGSNVAVAETTRLIDGIEPRVAKATATAQRLEEARARLEESVASGAGPLRRVRRGARARAARQRVRAALVLRASQRSISGRTRPGCSSPTSTASSVDAIVRRTTVTRLGEGVDASRRLLPAAIDRVHAVLARVPPRARRARCDARRSRSRRARCATRRTAPSSCAASRRRSTCRPGCSSGDEEARADAARRRRARRRDARARRRRRLDGADPRRVPRRASTSARRG